VLTALLRAVATVHGCPAPDPDLGYVEAGGRLALAPAVVRKLSAVGMTGVGPHDFTLPLSLRSLAGLPRTA